jgi:hypothetical protein
MTGALGVTSGSAASPSVFISGDTNTGLYSPGADQVAISTNGTGRLFVDANGRVGVGTASPTSALHIDVASGEPLRFRSRISGSNYFAHVNHAGGDLAYVGAGGGAALNSGTTSDYAIRANQGALLFATNGNFERMRLDSSGRLGLGTSSASSRLHVYGSESTLANIQSTGASSYLLLGNSNNNLGYIGYEGTKFNFYPNNTANALVVTPTGVGIGTTSVSATGERLSVRNDSGPGIIVRSTGDSSMRFHNSADDASNSCQIHYYSGNSFSFETIPALPISFKTTNIERARIDSSGRLGVGTSTPNTILSLKATTDAYVTVEPGTTDGNCGLLFNNSAGTQKGVVFYDTDDNYMSFSTNNTERFRCDSSGRLLVGTSSTSSVTRAVIQGNSAGNSQAIAYFQRGSANPTSSDQLAELKFADSNGSVGAEIAAYTDAAWASNNYPGRLSFSTTASGASSPTERMRITNSGNILFHGAGIPNGQTKALVNTFSSLGAATRTTSGFFWGDYSSSNGLPQHMGNWASSYSWGIGPHSGSNDSILRIGTVSNDTNGYYWQGYANVYGGTYTNASDYRLKENVIPLSIDALDVVKRLSPVTYNIIQTEQQKTENAVNRTELGFIAHEVSELIPELVTGEKDAINADGSPQHQGLDYNKISVVLVKALQEATARIETLEAELLALKGA